MREKMVGMALLATLGVLSAACGSSSESVSSDSGDSASSAERPAQNACPSDGCAITITNAEADGEEIMLTWSANFDPDVAKNHIHLYWDIYSADQVSGDAADRGVEQGNWVPTDAYPTITTSDVISVAERGGSTMLCVTASDGDHNVIDSGSVDCRDVSDLLS